MYAIVVNSDPFIKQFPCKDFKYKKIFVFFSKRQRNVSPPFLLHKLHNPMLPPCVHFSNHEKIKTLCSPLVGIKSTRNRYQLFQKHPFTHPPIPVCVCTYAYKYTHTHTYTYIHTHMIMTPGHFGLCSL